MKNITLIFLSVFFSSYLFAQETIYTKATTKAVKVYRNSAELSNATSCKIPKGSATVVVGNISEHLNQESLQIGLSSKDITILSSQFVKNYNYNKAKNDIKDPETIKIIDSITLIKNKIQSKNIIYTTNKKTIELLDKNQTILVGGDGTNVNQLKELTTFYSNKRIELLKKELEITKKLKKLNTKLKNLEQRLIKNNSTNKEHFGKGVLVLNLSSKRATKTKFNISYLTRRASWNPFYEIKGASITKPLNIGLKGIIKQSTGVDWSNVNLTLINGNASRNTYAPKPYSWYLNKYTPPTVGYDRVRPVFNKKAKKMRVMEAKVMEIEKIKLEEDESASADFAVTTNQLNTSYGVDIPYSIKSNNKKHIVNLYNQKVKADYTYYVVPKMNNDVFLIAKIKDFNKYDFIGAKASIIFENMYIGETYINPSVSSKELKITLGNDSKLIAKKQMIKNKSGKKFFSNKQVKTITYDLIVKNNKKTSTNVELKDVYPISKNEEIVVELLDISNAKKNTTKGLLTWNIKVNAGQTKKIRISYTITYPKKMRVTGL